MKRLVGLLVLGLILSGCAPALFQAQCPEKADVAEPIGQQSDEVQQRRDTYLEDHPELSPAVQQAIENGDVKRGMTREQVRAALGEPTTTSAPWEDDGVEVTSWYYYYNVRCERYDEVRLNGEVVHVNKSIQNTESSNRFGSVKHLEPKGISKEEAEERRETYVDNHPDLHPAIQEAILMGRVIHGMTKEQVKASMGEPGNVGSIGDSAAEQLGYQGPIWYWDYQNRWGEGLRAHINFNENKAKNIADVPFNHL